MKQDRNPLGEKTSKEDEKQRFFKNYIFARKAHDAYDIQMCTPYVDDYLQYLLEIESNYIPEGPPQITPRKRGLLIDWMIDVHAKLGLELETLYLGVYIIDKFLARRFTCDEQLQLLAIGSFMIASKFEEKFAPCLDIFTKLGHGKYTEEEILKTEKYIFHIIGHEINFPQPLNFIRYASKADNYNSKVRTTAKYLLEQTLLYHEAINIKYSVKAMSCYFLAKKVCNEEEFDLFWSYCLADRNNVMKGVAYFAELFRFGVPYDSVVTKYSEKDVDNVVKTTEEFFKRYNELRNKKV